ncbi:MAG: M20/M25/M40 family metallo-hydrolase [Hyphomonadaceae bacterium]|nr:M20/M25/M40 family metallo-hydrolase [Hyphomonadaceae bacterium]
MRLLVSLLAALFVASAAAQTPSNPILAPPTPPAVAPIPPAAQATVERLRAAALESDLAYGIVESLTTEVGARLAGSEAEARARAWGVAQLKALGFQNVRVEPFAIPYWARTLERATVTAADGATQTFVVVALGGSAPTPAGGVQGEVVRFASMAAFNAAPAEAVAGRIVFIDEPTVRSQDGSGYGQGVAKRGACAPAAQSKGALACVIRSVGTHSHRFAHQGGSARQPAGVAFPAAAISPPDADQLARLMARGPVRLTLEIAVETRENAPSGNVVGEIVGRERPEEIVLIGGHLDSWDQGTGALDDGAGVAITTAAAKLIRDLPRRPRRTIRVVMFGAEETGIHGGRAYAERHAASLDKHVIAAESDFGARAIWRLRTRVGEGALPYARALHAAVAPLAVTLGDNTANGGPDLGPMRAAGVPMLELGQNGWDYFDYHHTPDDTLDKIDRAELRQNVAVYAAAVWLAAEMDWDFRAPAAPQPVGAAR